MYEYEPKGCFKNIFLPDDVDWKSIEGKLAYRILSLPNRIKRECEACIWLREYSYGYADEMEFRHACIGLEVNEIAEALRKNHGLPQRYEPDAPWMDSPVSILRGIKSEFEQKQEAERRNVNRKL